MAETGIGVLKGLADCAKSGSLEALIELLPLLIQVLECLAQMPQESRERVAKFLAEQAAPDDAVKQEELKAIVLSVKQ